MILHAFHKCAKKNAKTGEATLDRHHAKKFFKKLNGIEAPPDALDYLGFEAYVEFPEAVIKYKVEDYNEYMKHRQETLARHKDWISKYTSFSSDGHYFKDAELKKMVKALLKHPVDDAAFLYAQQATKSVEMPLKVEDAHRFFLAYEKMLREDDEKRAVQLREHPGCLRSLFRCLLCIPI